jgi:Mu-like prophage protein gp16
MAAAQPHRNRQLAQVHILKGKLGLSDEVYRDVLQQLTDKRSASELSTQELARVLAHLKSKQAKKPKHQHVLDPSEAKVWSLWQQLADAGKVKNRSMTGLMGYVKTHIGRVDHISWLDGAQLHNLIEQLKAWLDR